MFEGAFSSGPGGPCVRVGMGRGLSGLHAAPCPPVSPGLSEEPASGFAARHAHRRKVLSVASRSSVKNRVSLPGLHQLTSPGRSPSYLSNVRAFPLWSLLMAPPLPGGSEALAGLGPS